MTIITHAHISFETAQLKLLKLLLLQPKPYAEKGTMCRLLISKQKQGRASQDSGALWALKAELTGS